VIATTNADGTGVLPVPLDKLEPYQNIPTIFFQRDFSEAFKYSRQLARWLTQNVADYDLVHIHAVFSHACLAASSVCRSQGVPYLVRTIGNLDPWSLEQKQWRKKLFWHLGVKQMLRGAAAIHYTTSAEQELAENALGLTRGVVIPLGVDNRLLQPAPAKNPFLARYPELRKSPYVLTLCRLHPKKNLEALLSSFLQATEHAVLHNWKLVIVGEGDADYTDKLQALTRTVRGAQSVLFTGWLQGEMKQGALQAASLFALPSYQENFGLSVVEAMACSVPVVISEHVNLATDIAEAQAGWVVTLTETALREALIEAMSSPQLREGRGLAARNLVRKCFTWPAVATQLVKLYKNIYCK
jgi:glycosyltransferase involved in cell wall biosynthesis